MSEMIERVARAICLAREENPDQVVTYNWLPFEPHPAWQAYADDARAAIEAMREPTAEMLSAQGGWRTATDDYRAMVDAALKDAG